MIQNPILPGFHADPSICRKGNDFYLAVSSFEWFPGIPIYHSKDLKHWELYAHGVTNAENPDLKKLPSGKGLWAPCLTYCEADDLFYLVYGVMNSMNARYFDVDNFLMTAKDPKGPWSEPVYLHSSGFDASLFHDDDGKKYIVALEWETRLDYEKPGPINIVEYDPVKQEILGIPKPFWRGGTVRGCIEAPHLTKHGDYYYIMCAEGGTGYYHSVTMGRSKNVYGPYEKDPANPILTSNPLNADERKDVDHLKPHYYYPLAPLQKAGHASYVELPNGETWMAFHAARPFLPELRCTLGRETCIQQMRWTEDGWLRTLDDSPIVKAEAEESALPPAPLQKLPARDNFEGTTLRMDYYAPRIDPSSFASLTDRPGWLRLRGQEFASSCNKASLLARKLESLQTVITTKMEFTPLCYQQSAGLILYYDNMNFIYLHKTYSKSLDSNVLAVMQVENGIKAEFKDSRIPLSGNTALFLRLAVDGRKSQFYYSFDGELYNSIGPVFDTSLFSDEYSNYGEFTGTFAGMFCADRMLRKQTADFNFFEMI